MDSTVLIKAIESAIRAGAKPAPPEAALGQDVSFVRTQTDIAIEPDALDAYLNGLKADADMASFDGMFANVPHGGGVSVSLASIARLLLARAIVTNDIVGTVERFISFVTQNAAKATAVMAVSGIRITAPIKLGPEIALIPLTALPPSPQRGVALGQRGSGAFGPRFPIPAAVLCFGLSSIGQRHLNRPMRWAHTFRQTALNRR